VMPTCMGLGEAAGTGVVLAEKSGCVLSDVSGDSIRHMIGAGRLAAGLSPFDELFTFDTREPSAVGGDSLAFSS
jgi:hypothetical protein